MSIEIFFLTSNYISQLNKQIPNSIQQSSNFSASRVQSHARRFTFFIPFVRVEAITSLQRSQNPPLYITDLVSRIPP